MPMDDELRADTERDCRRAEMIVGAKVGFLRHLLVYVLVNLALLLVNLLTSSDFFWFLLILGGWGVFLFSHFLSVFVFRGERFERWRLREIQRELEKLRKQR